MTANRESPAHIVIGYDFSALAELALGRAVAMAQADPSCVLHVLAVLDDRGGLGPFGKREAGYVEALEIQETLTREIGSRLQDADPARDVHFFVHTRIGDPATQILHLARELGAHLVVVGSRGHSGLERLLMGSVSEKVVREARCPVLVARPREYEDVELLTVVAAPADAKEPYVKPHRYVYTNGLIEQRSPAWPWY